ncbi:two-component system sensor histidine kinase [Campylobacter corcagiensis]|nr:two-component system sensor histidine kinase [Campylobacter corcagiensis]
MPNRSLRAKFILQLICSSAMLILIFSGMLYQYIKINIFENVVQVLNSEAKRLTKESKLPSNYSISTLGHNQIFIDTYPNTRSIKAPKYTKKVSKNSSTLTLEYPFDSKVIALTTDTTFYSNIIKQILTDIIIINTTMIFLILFFAMFLSRSLLIPVKTITKNLSNLNETVLKPLDESEIPLEFRPLSKGINRLINRIETFVSYQKELFIGIAHELKTPLAVMKTKNEVTLLKPRDNEKYINTLKSNNASIDSMNKMIGSILEVGRQEGAHFENAENKEMISFVEELFKGFRVLAKAEKKDIILKQNKEILYLQIRPNLLIHILQNFVQNAVKFSPENSTILIQTRVTADEYFRIDVVDEGCGIDESRDLFAPFRRYGDKSGAGLGLFLAKGAAEAMNAEIYIRNRNDKKGAIATLRIPISEASRRLNKEKSEREEECQNE